MHIISVAGWCLLILYFLPDSLVQRTIVVTMKIVAKRARTAMTMRQCFATPKVEQDWGSVMGGVFEAGCFVVTSRWIIITGGEVEFVVVLVENGSVGYPVEAFMDSAVELVALVVESYLDVVKVSEFVVVFS